MNPNTRYFILNDAADVQAPVELDSGFNLLEVDVSGVLYMTDDEVAEEDFIHTDDGGPDEDPRFTVVNLSDIIDAQAEDRIPVTDEVLDHYSAELIAAVEGGAGATTVRALLQALVAQR